MSKRLTKLWRKTVPGDLPCPQADGERVWRRVAAEAAPRRSPRLRRTVRWAAAVAAVLVLLTATAAAGGALSEYSVFSEMFRGGEPSEYALSLVDMEPKSVSNNGYTMTVTSSVGDDSQVLFTLEIKPETEEARAFLASEEFENLTASESVRKKASDHGPIALTASWIGWGTMGLSWSRYDPETDSVRIEANLNVDWSLYRQVSVHMNAMEDDVWLRFGVNRVPSVTVDIAEEAEEPGVYQVRLSPISAWFAYVVQEDPEEPEPRRAPMPEVSVLWEDGTLTNLWEIDALGPSGHGRSVDDELWHYERYWRFESIQDFSEVIAVVYDGMAYPLNGGESYALEQA